MKKDEQGFGVETLFGKDRHMLGAPAATHWHCPECDHNSAVADWLEGDGDTRACPNCHFAFDIQSARRISEADPGRTGLVLRDPDHGGYVPPNRKAK